MGDTLADDQVLSLVYRDPDSLAANSDFVFIRVTCHALKIPQRKGIGGQQLSKHNTFSLSLYFFW
jgi:hypothetical protein